MSTKIYDGIIIDIPQNQLWASISQIRENIENTFNILNKKLTIDYIKNSYVESAVRNYRNALGFPVNDDKKDSGLFFNALEKWKSEKEDFFKDKLSCKVQIFEPLEDGRILGYVFTNNEQMYYDNLLKLPFIEEFGYWNNTDQPEELTDTQWNDRRSAWTTVLDRNFYFTGSGFSVEVAESKNRTFTMPDEELIQEINKTLLQEDNNWHSALSIRLISDIVINNNKTTIEESIKSGSTSTLMNIIHTTMDVVQNLTINDLPISNIQELSLEDFVARDTKSVKFPDMIKENVDGLVTEVEVKIREDS